jgi:vitamin B12 transporter
MPASRSAGSIGAAVAALAVAITETFLCSRASAEEPPPEGIALTPVVVTATRLPTPESEVASSITVITREEIEGKQERALPSVLLDVPGLNVVQTGGAGGLTSVFIRGTNSNQTKVFVDGIDVGDPSAAIGAFDFAHLLTFGIERVEVLRGPQSALYGSDAIGGVVNIITQKGTGPAQAIGSLEGGSFGTFNQFGLARGALERFTYAFDAEHLHFADTPVTPLGLLPPGRLRIGDSYDNKTFGAKLGANLTDTLDVGLVARYIDTALGFTGDDLSVFPSVPAASQSTSQTRQLFARAMAHQVLIEGLFDHALGLGYTADRRRDFSPGSAPDHNRGDRIKLDWQGNLRLAASEILTIGAEHQIDQIRSSPISAEITDDAGFIQLQSSFDERLFDTISLRYDSYDRFGGKMTYRVAPAFLIPETGTKLKGTVGTGFKTPTLNELFVSFPAFNFFANPNLRPETSLGYDLGFEQAVPEQPVTLGATYFHNDLRNLITANATFTSNENIGRATTYGVESFAEYRPLDTLALRADYTFTIADNDLLHQELLRRPRHKVSLDTRWQITEPASLWATLVYVSPSADVNRSGTVSGLRANGYTIVNLAGTYELGHGLTAFARIDNLLDRRYQNPTGFLRPGLSAFAGFKLALDSGALNLVDKRDDARPDPAGARYRP